MTAEPRLLGMMKPLGGGDPVPLYKEELVVGRRPSCDVCLDFENISGKHCMLRFKNQVWHVKDMASTNGTTINGAAIASEHSLMPDDELGIAGHLYFIEYEPGAPISILDKHTVLEDDLVEAPKRHSLMELAGLKSDENRERPPSRPARAPTEPIPRARADEETEFLPDLPDDVPAAPAVGANDDDFFKFIEEDVLAPAKDPKKK